METIVRPGIEISLMQIRIWIWQLLRCTLGILAIVCARVCVCVRVCVCMWTTIPYGSALLTSYITLLVVVVTRLSSTDEGYMGWRWLRLLQSH